MRAPLLQGVIQPVLSTEETSIYVWIIGYVILLISSWRLVASKLRNNWRKMRNALLWQLGWTLLLLLFPPLFAPLVWLPVSLSWIILGFLFSLDLTAAPSRRSLRRRLVVKPFERRRAREEKSAEQVSSGERYPLPPQKPGADEGT